MSPRRRFGRRGPNPAAMTAALIAALLVLVLAVLFVNRKTPPARHAPDVVAVIVSGGAGGAQRADFERVLTYAKDHGDVLVLASARHPDVAQRVPLARTGINDLERDNHQAAEVRAARQLYQSAVVPGGNVDLQQSFSAVADIVHTFPHGRVWVAALGPVTDVAVGVRLDDPLTRGDPATSIADFSGGYVSSCAGWDLNVAAGGVQPSSLAQAQVREYWRRLMRSCGGRLTGWTIHVGKFPATQEVLPWTGAGHCGVTFELAGQTLFNTGQYQLRPGAGAILGSILGRFEGDSQARIVIDGYTDSQGSMSFNQSLSDHRAQSVGDWFLDRDVAASQVTAEGHGEASPVASNATAVGRQLNRRVDVTLLSRSCPQVPGAGL